MAREWSDLLLTREPAHSGGAARELTAATPGARGGFLRRLRDSLRATREALGSELGAGLGGALDAHDWEALEEALILADVGAPTTAAVVASLEDAVRAEKLDVAGMRERLATILARVALGEDGEGEPLASQIDLRAEPAVILMAGVNGTGKTTTLGKLAWQLREHFGLCVLLGAADTFRAAATEQLEVWAGRSGAQIVTGSQGSDPGAVAYETVTRARAEGFDVALIDTAGRLHTQDNLMAELQKIRRVIERQIPGAPHETLLTIDATTGQNGLRQAQLFAEALELNGIVLTKLDGTAKGGVALGIARELAIPVKLIGIGEGIEDLRPFDAHEFARALVDAD